MTGGPFPRAAATRWLTWLALSAAVTAMLVLLRGRLDTAHIALVYLLVVLGASARGGRALGLSIAVITFLGFNFFFLPPYHALTLSRPLDGIVLLVYLVTAAVAAQLLTRAEREAAERIRLAAEAEHAKALREADRMKDALLAAVSHDLRTPLTTIAALGQEIASQGDERALVIAQEADRLGRFVGDLLDFSELRAGASHIRPELNAVEDLLGAAIQRVSGALAGHELRAQIDPGDPILLGRFDFVHTLRIIVNLLENALKYSPPGQPVELSASRRDSLITIVVGDRGPGVPEAERERIFQPFYRAPGVAPDVGGAGLGLAIAAGLAKAQGGSLRYQPRPGGGSLFLFSCPAADMPTIVEPASVS
jgi:two-component system sensor histidine kinase KdpD